MWRASLLAIAIAVVASPAGAERDADREAKRAEKRERAIREYIAKQIESQAAVVGRAVDAVKGKLAEVDGLRTRRMTAIARMLDISDDGSVVSARRRGAARLLADRDLAERKLLVAELAELEAAARRIAEDAAHAPIVALPPQIGPPAKGTIAREFGTYEHDRSGALLSRRGIDIETETGRATIVAPATGVVKYAGEIRGLDSGVILDHGTFTTVIGKLGEISVPIGAKLAKGDRIGRTARHRVYLEVRVKLGPGGLPVDPAPLLERPRSDDDDSRDDDSRDDDSRDDDSRDDDRDDD